MGNKVSGESKNTFSLRKLIIYIICGIFIGVGAELPGISGGVLCVIFGIYRPIMDLISNPIKTFKTNALIVIPTFIGVAIGMFLSAKALVWLLETYPNQGTCLFIGLIIGMLPSLFREAGQEGRGKKSYVSMGVAFAVILGVLILLKFVANFTVAPNFGWYMFIGFAMALSIIIPGMSYSVVLMPFKTGESGGDLYQILNSAISELDISILVFIGIGAVVTIVLLAKPANWLMKNHYSVTFHAIIGIVIAATAFIIPFESFAESVNSAWINLACVAVGVGVSLVFGILEKKNAKE
ncbi:MAG: DUF368 domain-containing protein [Ruminococcus sp.]